MLLSDEEIEFIIDRVEERDRGMTGDPYPNYLLAGDIAKAQLKKVVEWLKAHNELNDEPFGSGGAYGYDPMEKGTLLIYPEEWRVLLLVVSEAEPKEIE